MTRAWVTWRLCGGATAAVAAMGGTAHGQALSFSDQTAPAGLIGMHTPSNAYLHMPSGGAVGDFDRDGWQDVFFLAGGAGGPDKLFMNNGDGTFTDAAAAWGVARTHYGFGAAVGDYDGDGWLDVYVTSGGSESFPRPHYHILYRNSGNGTFTDVALPAGVRTTATGFFYDGWSPAFGDYDLDGDLDLAVAGWAGEPGGNRLFRNNGNGTFTSVGAPAFPLDNTTRGFSPRFADMDGDRWPELLWVSDFGTSKYLVNNGNGSFTDTTGPAGVGLDGNGMGTCVVDLDNDGLLDWYVSSIYTLSPDPNDPAVPGTGNMLYMNQGGHAFAEASAAAGVKDGAWGWGCIAVDFDHDTLFDMAETNGWYDRDEWLGENSFLFMNNGDGTFTDDADLCNFTGVGEGRGMVNFDYDNDGDQDVVIFFNQAPPRLLRNELSGPAANWLRLLFDTSGDPGLAPDGYGTRVVLRAGAGNPGGGITRYGYLAGGSNYLSQSELSVHFGLGAHAVADEVRVEWADGRVTTLTDVAANQTLVVSSPGAASGCDVDGTAGVNVFDLLTYLDLWFAGDAAAELDGAAGVDVFDLLAFLDCWFAG